jgi:hypothetical protein
MLGEMGIGKQSMREVIGYHVYNAATLTLDTAGTLCTVMMATSLLFNFEGATWNIRSVLGEVSSPALSQTVKDGLALLQKLNDDYVAKRASLLTLKPHYELGDETIPPGPPSTWLYREYELVDHSPGDTYMKKLNGLFPRRRVPNSIPAAERSKHVVQILWAETKVGGEALPQTIRDITSMVDVLDLAA